MRLILLSLLLLSSFAFAQDLSKKIASDANMVLKINGGKTLESVSEEELEQSRLFEEMVREFYRGEDKIKSLIELGVDYSQPMYVVNERQTDLSLFYFAFQIKNLGVFENSVKKEMGDAEIIKGTDGALNQIKYHYNSRLFWNGEYAILITADYTGSEFSEWYNDYEYYNHKEEAVYEEEVAPEAEYPSKEMTEEEYQEYLREQEEIRKKEEEERRKREE